MNNFFEKLIHFGFLYEDLIAPARHANNRRLSSCGSIHTLEVQMTKEDYFRKNFPDYCTKQEGLSPL